MRNVTRVGVLALTLILATGLIGATSFTQATLTRDTNIDVVSDTNGYIALEDKLSGDVVREDSTGELTIDFTTGSAQGVNVDSIYELGTPGWSDNSTDEQAFNITNHDSVTRTINLNYTIGTAPGDGAGHNATEFQVYDSSGTSLATISEDDTGASFSLTSGETVAVVVIVDSTDGAITQSDDLSGTLNVTAT